MSANYKKISIKTAMKNMDLFQGRKVYMLYNKKGYMYGETEISEDISMIDVLDNSGNTIDRFPVIGMYEKEFYVRF